MANLTPEDIMLMKQAIAEAEAGGGHPDAAQDQQQIQPLIDAILYLAEVNETQNERLNKLESIVMDDIIGGITGLYKNNLRADGLSSLKGKYGPMFEPHMGTLSTLYPDTDIFEKLYDLKEEDGLDDDGLDSTVQDALAKLGALQVPGRTESAEAVLPGQEDVKLNEAPDLTTVKIEKLKGLRSKLPKDFQL